MIINKEETKTDVLYGGIKHHERIETTYHLECAPHELKLILKALDKIEGDDFRNSVNLTTTIRGLFDEKEVN